MRIGYFVKGDGGYAGHLHKGRRRVVVKAQIVRHKGTRFTANPPLPESARASAQAQGRERYEGFVEALSRKLEGGTRFAGDFGNAKD